MKQLWVELPNAGYAIEIGVNILKEHLPAIVSQHAAEMVVVLTNTTIDGLYPRLVEKVLAGTSLQVRTCVLPDGEEHKNLTVLNQIYDFLMTHRANRNTVIVAFGGGVIGDMSGFAAATFMRGIDYIQVPTTLLAHVDSSVGGKTAVNHALGKNTIGAFKQPRHVLIDLALLKTLPERELKAGYAELIKHGFIHDLELFEFLEARPGLLQGPQSEDFSEAVYRSCRVKKRVVEQDEKEAGLRATLNFGHTLAHLIETKTGYTKYLHGEAVAVGMVYAAFVSQQTGHLSASEYERVIKALKPITPLIELPTLGQEEFVDLLLHDKKSAAAKVNFILIDQIGRSFIQKGTDPIDLWNHFRDFLQREAWCLTMREA